MEIFLLILKIIGIVLAVLAAFIVFAIVTPFTYKAEGSFHDKKPDGEVRAGWLLNLVRIFAYYHGGKGGVQVKVLFFTVFDSTKKKKKKRSKKKKKKRPPALTEQPQAEHPPEPVSLDNEEFDIEDSEYEEEETGIIEKVKGIFKKIADFFRNAKEKINGVLVWLDPEHRRLLKFLWENGVKIIMKVKPKKFNVNGFIGTGDPYSTGTVFSYIALAVGLFGIPGIELEPDYDEKRIDIDAEASGRFFVLPVALIALKIYRNKDFQRFILKKDIPVEGQ